MNKWFLSALVAACFVGQASASTVLTFDGALTGNNTFIEQDFKLTSQNGDNFLSLLFGPTPNSLTLDGTVIVEHVNGTSFAAKEIMVDTVMAAANGQQANGISVTFNAMTTSAGAISQTFNLDNQAGFENLVFNSDFWDINSLSFESGPNPEQFIYWDNVHFDEAQTVATPIPAAAWLFGSALVGLTSLRKIQK